MAKEDKKIIRITQMTDTERRLIQEFHEERDLEVLDGDSDAGSLLRGTRDRAWRETRYQLPEGKSLLDLFGGERRRQKLRQQRGRKSKNDSDD